MITFDHLQNLLSDWYEASPFDLGLPDAEIPDGINPILKDFYVGLEHWLNANPNSHTQSPTTPRFFDGETFAGSEIAVVVVGAVRRNRQLGI